MKEDTLFDSLQSLNKQGGGDAEWPVIARALRAAQKLRAKVDLEDDADWGAAAAVEDFDKAFAAVFGEQS